METIPSAIVPPESIAPRQNGLANSRWDEVIEQRRTSERKRLLVVGRLSPEKRIDRAIRAWGTIARKYPEWVLRIVGDGALREELMKLRFQQVTGQLTDTSRLRILRRDIARMESILNELVAE